MSNASNARRIRIGGWLVDYDDAQTEVVLERTVGDILSATPGHDGECMNSQCIKRHRQDGIFPHPVYIVSTIKSRVYIVDRLDDKGDPAHAVRYELSRRDSDLIANHDESSAGEPGTLVLRVPKDPKGSPKRASYPNRFAENGRIETASRKFSGRKDRPALGHGASARFKVAVGAGLVDPR